MIASVTLAVLLGQPALGPTEVPEVAPEPEGREGLPEVQADCARAEAFGGSELERAAFCAARASEYASSRTLADAALEADPASFRAHYVLGLVQHLGEGNLPKSLHHLEQAEEGFLAAHRVPLEAGEPGWFVGRLITWELMDVHGEMDHHHERIAYADRLTEWFGLDYEVFKAWPLMKLGRFDAARAVVEAALASDDPWNRNVARTSLCAIESELRNREAAYVACAASADVYRGDESRGAVELTNAGSAAEETLRFDEAERRFLEAAKRPPDTTVNPWLRLLSLYLRQGRFSEALDALRKMDAYRARRPRPHLDQQDAAESDTARAALALALGFPDVAAELARAILARPDRQGTSSAASDQNAAGGAVFARATYLARARELEARAAVLGFGEAMRLRARSVSLRFDGWMAGRTALSTLSKPERLVTTLRPEVPGSLEMPSWLDAEVIPVVGAGVAAAALDVGRAQETLPEDRVGAVFDAYAAEVAWRSGDDGEAVRLGLGVLRSAERGFTLLAGRAAAIAGAAAAALGRSGEALEGFMGALERDPGVLPRLGIPLPVRLEGVDAAGRAAAERLSGSPRLDEVPWGFVLRVHAAYAELAAPDGTLLTIVQQIAPPEDVDDPDGERADRVQRRLFMPRVDLAQSGVGSLGGGTGAGERADETLRELLRGPKR